MVNNKLRLVDVIDLYMNELLLFIFVDFRNIQGLCNIYNYSCSTATLANHLWYWLFHVLYGFISFTVTMLNNHVGLDMLSVIISLFL